MKQRARSIMSDIVGRMEPGETITVHEIMGEINERLRYASVSTGEIANYARMIGLERVGAGLWRKV